MAGEPELESLKPSANPQELKPVSEPEETNIADRIENQSLDRAHDTIQEISNLESSDTAQKERQNEGGAPLLVFGQGPVIDKDLRERASDVNTTPGNEDVNFWSKNLSIAASELYKHGQAGEIIVLGGRTGGENYKSEAELIGQNMHSLGVPEGAVRSEHESHDTLANLINIVNILDEKGEKVESFQILSSKQHLARLKVIMRLLDLPVGHAFAAEEVIRNRAREGTEEGKWDNETLALLEGQLDVNHIGHYDNYQGLEKRSYKDRLLTEDMLTRELLTFPESWLGRVAEINNGERYRPILERADKIYPGVLKEKFGIDMETDGTDEIRDKLRSIKKNPLDEKTVEEWKTQVQNGRWPQEIEDRLLMITEDKV